MANAKAVFQVLEGVMTVQAFSSATTKVFGALIQTALAIRYATMEYAPQTQQLNATTLENSDALPQAPPLFKNAKTIGIGLTIKFAH